MKLLFVSMLIICMNGFGQTTSIPDVNFESRLIDLGYDIGPIDGSVLTANINSITELDLEFLGINDLTGIQDFTSLKVLNCRLNNLSSLNVSSLLDLEVLICDNNDLNSLDISQNVSLRRLSAHANYFITSLDVSNNIALEFLACGFNQLTALDLTSNSSLTYLSCESAPIGSLDVSQNNDLDTLDCANTGLTSLDLSQNPNLIVLNCSNNNLPNLNLSNLSQLKDFWVASSNLLSLDVSSLVQLEFIHCAFNQINELDFSNCSNLVYVQCSSNNLSCLNLKNGNNLNLPGSNFACQNNPLLSCVEVDDTTYSVNNWSNIDGTVNYSDACNNACSSSFVGVKEVGLFEQKELVGIFDLMGRAIDFRPNTILIYSYSDGTSERVIELE